MSGDALVEVLHRHSLMIDDVPPAERGDPPVKVVTVLGTRPEVIRLSRVIEKLDRLCDHRLVHTGQNFDPALSDVFFDELEVRKPDHYLGVRAAGFAAQAGQILEGCERVFLAEEPDAC